MLAVPEADLRYDEWRTNPRNPVRIRVTHIPSGWTGEAVDASPTRARRLALARLELALIEANVLIREPSEKVDRSVNG